MAFLKKIKKNWQGIHNKAAHISGGNFYVMYNEFQELLSSFICDYIKRTLQQLAEQISGKAAS